MKSSRLIPVLALLIAVSVASAADPGVVQLPAVKTSGPVSVEQALNQRRSLRNPDPAPLTLGQIGQLCWAAQGLTDEKGHRTAPSAMATYPLELYVIAGAVTDLEPGLYHYEPTGHALKLVTPGDQRKTFMEKAVGQEWIATAPAIFVISGVAGRMDRMKERAAGFMWVEAGLAAQGFFLEATALGLGSTYVGGFAPPDARTALGLASTEEVLAVLPVGRKP